MTERRMGIEPNNKMIKSSFIFKLFSSWFSLKEVLQKLWNYSLNEASNSERRTNEQ